MSDHGHLKFFLTCQPYRGSVCGLADPPPLSPKKTDHSVCLCNDLLLPLVISSPSISVGCKTSSAKYEYFQVATTRLSLFC